jgi:hypothetical protein
MYNVKISRFTTSCGKLGTRLFGFEKHLLIGCCSIEQNPHQRILIVRL